MAKITATEGDLGRQPRGARQQATRRLGLALSQLPMTVEGAPGLFDHADAVGHHHQAGGRRVDARVRQRQRLARQICGRERQEAAQAIVEDEHRVLALHLHAAAPTGDLVKQVAGAIQFDQPALLHAASQRQQGLIEVRCPGKERGDAAPCFRRVNELRSLARLPSRPATWATVAHDVHLPAGNGDLSQRADSIHRVEEGCFMAGQLGRQA